jgi:C1A family cysteine protease
MKLPKFNFEINFFTLVKLFRKYILRKKVQSRNFGLKPDKWDERDIYYKVRRPIELLPPSTNRKNINEFSYRYDQGSIGSCVGNGTVEAFRRILQVNKMPDFELSRLFAYYIAREEKYSDSGASIRDAFKAINKFGICSEKTWPYIPDKFAVEPPEEAFAEALDHQSISYERIYPVTKDAIMDALSHRFPVVYGMRLFESFMSVQVARTGIIPMPKKCESEVGGHCKVLFDYEPKKVIELNSWGPEWGQGGIDEVPWEYILSKYCSDFWVFYKTE